MRACTSACSAPPEAPPRRRSAMTASMGCAARMASCRAASRGGCTDGKAARELVLTRLREDTSFLLVTHEHPDGDALGSLIGMQGLLTALGKRSEMYISPEDLPLPREYRALRLTPLIEQPPADIGERTVIFIDCGNIDRIAAEELSAGPL